MLDLKLAARAQGVSLVGRRLFPENLRGLAPPLLTPPLIAAVARQHFIVVTQVDEFGWFQIADPAIGVLRVPFDQLRRIWRGECLLVTRVERRVLKQESGRGPADGPRKVKA